MAADLWRLECDDPMLLYMVSRSCDVGGSKNGVMSWATKELGKSDFNPLWAFMAQIEKIARVDYGKKEKQMEALDGEALRRLEKACKAGCLENDQYVTALPGFYRDVIVSLAKESDNFEAYYQQDWVYESLMGMHEGQAKACVDNAGRHYNWTEMAVLAYRMEDYDELTRVWKKLAGRPWRKALDRHWKLDREDFAFCAQIDQFDRRIKSARVFREQKLYGSAIDEYEVYWSQEGIGEDEQKVLRKRIALLKLEEKWNAGDWVTLWPTDSPELWRAAEGSWKKLESGALEASSKSFRYAIEHSFVCW